jgi:hypothetical protein
MHGEIARSNLRDKKDYAQALIFTLAACGMRYNT